MLPSRMLSSSTSITPCADSHLCQNKGLPQSCLYALSQGSPRTKVRALSDKGILGKFLAPTAMGMNPSPVLSYPASNTARTPNGPLCSFPVLVPIVRIAMTVECAHVRTFRYCEPERTCGR